MCDRKLCMDEFQTRVLDGIQSLTERMVRVETKLDSATNRLDSHEIRLSAIEKSVPDPDHEARLRKLERAVWIAGGIALAGGGALGSILSSITGG